MSFAHGKQQHGKNFTQPPPPPSSFASRSQYVPQRELDKQQLKDQCDYTQQVLCRYKDYVENTLQAELDMYVAACDKLGEDVDMLKGENAQLRAHLDDASKGLEAAKRVDEVSAVQLRAEVARITTLHEQHLADVEKARQAESRHQEQNVQRLRAEVARLNGQGIDMIAETRVRELEDAVRTRDADIKKLKMALAAKDEQVLSAETRALSIGPTISGVSSTIAELLRYIEESSDFSLMIGQAYEHLDVHPSSQQHHAADDGANSVDAQTPSSPSRFLSVDGATPGSAAAIKTMNASIATNFASSNPWRPLFAHTKRQVDGVMGTSLPDGGDRGNTNTSVGDTTNSNNINTTAEHRAQVLKDIVEELGLLCIGIRNAARHEKMRFASALKLLALRQKEMTAKLAEHEHDRQRERELAKVRIGELESDRRSERERLMQVIEKQRMRSVLLGGGAGNFYAGQGGGGETGGSLDEEIRLLGGTAAAMRHPSTTAQQQQQLYHRGAAAAAAVAQATPQLTTTSSIACQTSMELLQSYFCSSKSAAMGAVGGGGDQLAEASERLFQDYLSLKAQLRDHKETIQLLEAQRKRFMSFVDDDRISAHVDDVLTNAGLDGAGRDALQQSRAQQGFLGLLRGPY